MATIQQHREENDRIKRQDALAAGHLSMNDMMRKYAVRNRVDTPPDPPARDDAGKFVSGQGADGGAKGGATVPAERTVSQLANSWLRGEDDHDPFNDHGPRRNEVPA